jgi:PAS domain S-box-containing protein
VVVRRLDLLASGLLDAAPDAIVVVDGSGVIVLMNAQAERLFGYSRDELVGERVDVLVPESARQFHPRHRAAYTADPRPRPMGAADMQLAGRRRDGSEFPAEISLSAIESEDGIVVSAAVRDVTDRRRIEQQLREKAIELEQASRAKDTFLASMSHELRTPLNAIIGFTGTLLMQLPGPLNDEQLRQLHTVQNSGRHLLAIINDLLDLAKIESGAVKLTLEPVDCVDVVTTVVTSLEPLADGKQLKVITDLPDHPVVVASDSRALGQIMINLINNAIKFTNTGQVNISVSHNETTGAARISVVDTGPGISAEHLTRIFNAYERGPRTIARDKEGTGLGLHISQKLAGLIGATITAESQEGFGSTFCVTLGGT